MLRTVTIMDIDMELLGRMLRDAADYEVTSSQALRLLREHLSNRSRKEVAP